MVYVAAALTGSIFVINVVLDKPILDALLFSLAIAVGITPQLLPAVVSASLAAGAKRMSARKVVVKRLVCIEDLGDVDMLFTDKTGTLTAGSISFMRTVSAEGAPSIEPLKWGLLCTEVAGVAGAAVGGNSLDTALWDSPAAKDQAATIAHYRRVSLLPFDHDRRLVSVLVQDGAGHRIIVTKGAPETVLSDVSLFPPPPVPAECRVCGRQSRDRCGYPSRRRRSGSDFGGRARPDSHRIPRVSGSAESQKRPQR